MNRRTKLMIAKYALYVLLMVILYVLQTDPNLFAIAGVKPVLVLPFAVCIAMHVRRRSGIRCERSIPFSQQRSIRL